MSPLLVALTGKAVNIPDAYASEEFDFSGTKAFDANSGYRSMSFLTIPMKNKKDEVIGVVQLLNARDRDTGEHHRRSTPMIIPSSNPWPPRRRWRSTIRC